MNYCARIDCLDVAVVVVAVLSTFSDVLTSDEFNCA